MCSNLEKQYTQDHVIITIIVSTVPGVHVVSQYPGRTGVGWEAGEEGATQSS